jgi:post-segregation antitoxin (ccd killing protein)
MSLRAGTGGRIYSQTNLLLDAELKARAKSAGLNLSQTLSNAVKKELEAIEHGQGATTNVTPTRDSRATIGTVEQ